MEEEIEFRKKWENIFLRKFQAQELIGTIFILHDIEYVIDSLLLDQENTIVYRISQTDKQWNGILKLETNPSGTQILKERLVHNILNLYEYIVFNFEVVAHEIKILPHQLRNNSIGVIMPDLGIPLSLNLSDPEAKFEDTLLYLDKIHQRNVLHEDIKPGNILHHPKLGITIIDYGLSTIADEEKCGSIECLKCFLWGTPVYESPYIDWKISPLTETYPLPICKNSKMDDYIGLYYTFLELLGNKLWWGAELGKEIRQKIIQYDRENYQKRITDSNYIAQLRNDAAKLRMINGKFDINSLVIFIYSYIFDRDSKFGLVDQKIISFDPKMEPVTVKWEEPLNEKTVDYNGFMYYINFFLKILTSLEFEIPQFLNNFINDSKKSVKYYDIYHEPLRTIKEWLQYENIILYFRQLYMSQI